MANGVQTYRLGIAVFNRPDAVWPAVIALLDGGFGLHQLCLAARPETIARLPASAAHYRDRQPAMGALIDHVSGFTPPKTTAGGGKPGVLLRFQGPREGSATGGTNGHDEAAHVDWNRPELSGNVLDQINEDAIVLGVSSQSTRQQLVSTRILLEHSSHRVLTQEFILPAHH